LSAHLATDVVCGFNRDQSFYVTIFLHFQLHLLEKFTFYTSSAGTNRILYSYKHSRLRNSFHAVIFSFVPCSSYWLAGTWLKRLTHSLNVVIRHTRSTRTSSFRQASSFHKLSAPPGYIILVWFVFFKPCTILVLRL
jgi:hypothetical protein